MTQDEIIRMARELATRHGSRMCDEDGETHGEELYCVGIEDIAEIIKEAAAAEREACAKVCIEEAERHEEMSQYEDTADYAERSLVYGKHIRTCAAAIRARSNHAK